MKIFTIIALLAVADMLALLIDIIILHKYCDAGYLGYPDEWHSEKAEKLHYALASSSLVISIVIAALITIYPNFK